MQAWHLVAIISFSAGAVGAPTLFNRSESPTETVAPVPHPTPDAPQFAPAAAIQSFT